MEASGQLHALATLPQETARDTHCIGECVLPERV